MKEIRLKGLDEKIYYDVCENGLKIYIWVNEKINTFKGSLVFLGGAENTTFKIEGQEKRCLQERLIIWNIFYVKMRMVLLY